MSMNNPVIHKQTEAELALADLFAKAQQATAPDLKALREASFARFKSKGLAHKRIESWHYTDWRSAQAQLYPIVNAPDADQMKTLADQISDLQPLAQNTLRLVLVDGVFVPGLSASALPSGVTLTTLSQALATGHKLSRDVLVASALGETDSMLSLNAALANEGVLIEIAQGAKIEQAIELIFIGSGVKARSLFSRSAVFMSAGSELRLIERHVNAGIAMQSNQALYFNLAKGARLDHLLVCDQGDVSSLDLMSLMARLEAGADYSTLSLMLGSALRRRQSFVQIAGEEARFHASGVNLINRKDHLDLTFSVEHLSPHCESREFFNSIIDDQATGVFQGRVSVAREAQKTDGRMKSRAILLSPEASMLNKPELEIFADDVACGHGATCGELDQDQLFYAQARGIARPEAEAMLLEGFAAEIFDDVKDEFVKEALRAQIRRWLVQRGASASASSTRTGHA